MVIKKLQQIFFVALLSLSLSPSLAAPEKQSLESIHSAVRSFVRSSYNRSAKLEVRIGLNDNRLRLRKCAKPLTVAWTTKSRKLGNTSVGVRCNSTSNWTIHVPVSIRVFKPVMVASDTLSRGHRLDSADFHLEQRDISVLTRGYITRPKKYLGYSVKRQVNAGSVILPSMLEKPKIVSRGDRVTLIADAQGLNIRSQGIALDDATKGETVRIRNSSSKRIIEGRAISPGLVQIRL